MRKKLYFIFILFLSVFIFSVPVKADMGPKPTLNITIDNIKEDYYVDILFEDLGGDFLPEILEEHDLEYLKEKKLNLDSNLDFIKNYKDSNNFISYSLYKRPNRVRETHEKNSRSFSIGYRVPNNIKLLIYSPTDKYLVSSKVIKLKAFNSNIKVDLNTLNHDFNNNSDDLLTFENSFNLNEKHNVARLLFTFLITASITIIIELALLYLFKYRTKKSFSIVAATNLVTQIGLTLFLIFTTYLGGFLLGFFLFFLAEIIVLLVEIFVYMFFIKEHGKGRILLYTILANLITAALTFLPVLTV